MKFNGVLFLTSGDQGRASSTLNFNQSKVSVQTENYFQEWYHSEIDLEFGGSNNHLVFFKHKSGDTFYIEKNKKLILMLKGLNQDHFNQALRNDKKRSNRSMVIFLSIVFLVIGFFSSIFFQREKIVSSIVQKIPYSVEEKLGDALGGMSYPGGKKIHLPKTKKSLEELLAPIRKVIPKPYHNFEVNLSNSKDVNAFALPGGKIVFNLGLLQKAKSAEEILGVAAHEMAHVTQRHVISGIINSVGVFALVQLVFGDFSGLIAVIADNGSFLLTQSFSREMELQADEVGFQYMENAQINPLGMVSFFEVISKENEKSLGENAKTIEKGFEFFSTHPNTEKRIEIIKEKIKTLETKKYINLEKQFIKFQKILKEETNES